MRFRSRKNDERGADAELFLAAERGRRLVEESREFVLVLDADDRVVAASRRAREALEGVVKGTRVTEEMLGSGSSRVPFRVPYEVAGRTETLLYLADPGDLAAYEELRAGFTAAVSHELRTPLARLLALLETALLPGAETRELIDQARREIGEIDELIDDILFLGELETGRTVVGLGSTVALPVLQEVVAGSAESAARAGVRLAAEGDPSVELPLRPRMIRVVASNLVENAIRYAGAGATLTLSISTGDAGVVLSAADDGPGVAEDDLPRLFERFYRGDRARASRGTGLGLAIVKHVVTAAGGHVEASGDRGAGLTITCFFPR
jgi:two-component system phosphate regulon sensor histidine kinase PhoR